MKVRRKLELASALAMIAAAVGCNALLENEPGRLDEAGAASGGSKDDAGVRGRGPSSQQGGGDDDASASQISGSTGTGQAGSSGCSPGMKSCGDICVSTIDPYFGCASPACKRCDTPNATAACGATGACAVGTCSPGFGDCDALPTNGCEADLLAVTSCGSCGVVCPSGPHAAAACAAGACTLTCDTGFGNCNAKLEDGCEKNLTHDKHNCGACGADCIFGRCENGICVW